MASRKAKRGVNLRGSSDQHWEDFVSSFHMATVAVENLEYSNDCDRRVDQALEAMQFAGVANVSLGYAGRDSDRTHLAKKLVRDLIDRTYTAMAEPCLRDAPMTPIRGRHR